MSHAFSQTHEKRGGVRAVSAAAACAVAGSISAWLYAPYGYNGLDDGFIQALSWRVASGQLPYLDFVYIRPPGSVLLHALPMLVLPPELQVIFERGWFFLAVAAYSFIAAAVLNHVGGLGAWKLTPHTLALLFFVTSVQDFPPMAWHTVDGILFAVLAVFCVCCTRGVAGLAIGALFAVLSASCKQPFFAVPLATLAYVHYARPRRDAAIVGAVLTAAVVASALALGASGMLREAWVQCTSQTGLASLVHAGVLSYARGVPYLLIPIAAWWIAAAVLRRALGIVLPAAGMVYVVVLWIFGSDIVRTLIHQRFQTPAFNYPGGLFIVAVLAILVAGREGEGPGAPDRRARAVLALMLLVAWCASISWGYPTPVLFSAPVWFGALWLSVERFGAAPRQVVWLALALALAAQFTGYRFPYRESPRATLTAPLGETFDRLSHVYSSPANRQRFEELKSLTERYPKFTVLPALPSAHYLTGTLPPIGVDWARNSEAAGRTAELIVELEDSGAHVFLERSAAPPCETGPACSGLASHVVRRWRVEEEGEHFLVYGLGDPASAP